MSGSGNPSGGFLFAKISSPSACNHNTQSLSRAARLLRVSEEKLATTDDEWSSYSTCVILCQCGVVVNLSIWIVTNEEPAKNQRYELPPPALEL